MSILASDGGTGLAGYLDTMAQSFLVERNLHITKIDLYFSDKDPVAPVELTLRTLVNGLPSEDVVPNSKVVVPSANITTSANSSIATSFVFPVPVYLESGEYCFTLSSASKANRVFISELGGTDLVTGAVISKNPYSGLLFVSSNGVTWDLRQTSDIKFKLYRANITSSSAVVDLIPKKDVILNTNFKLLELNPFKSYNAASVVKVFHNNHGFPNGATVEYRGLPGWLAYAANTSANVTFNNIPIEKIQNVTFTVSNVTTDSYTIPLTTTAAQTANIVGGRFGGPAVVASSFLPYTSLYPAISSVVPTNSSLSTLVKTTDTSFTQSAFTAVNQDTIDFDDTKILVDKRNRDLSMSGDQSFVYRLQLASSDSYTSPQVDLSLSSVLFVTPDINNPTADLNLSQDLITITSANTTVSFDSTGTVTSSDAAIQANIKTMRPGAFVTISGAGDPSNNGTFRLTAVETDGSSFTIPAANAEPTGNVITLVYRPEFVSELAAVGGSSKSKYITRKIQLATPSTALLIRFALSKPAGSDVEVYYKTSASDEASVFASKEYTELDIGTIANTVVGQYVDVEKFIEDLPAFNELIIKIVLKTTERAKYPRLKDLRIIALE